jgi:dipeptidyl aminopeptidase/acylaminoacyl peptidase
MRRLWVDSSYVGSRELHIVAALVVSAACFNSTVAVAEASFPGRNGVIAFARAVPPFGGPESVGARTIWAVKPRSARTRQLTRVPRRCGRRGWTWSDVEPSFSASGRLVVFRHEDKCDPRSPDGIYIMRSDGSRRRLLVEDKRADQPALSADGETLAFDTKVGATTYLASVRQPDSKRELSVSGSPSVCDPSWSSTGRLALTLGVWAAHIGTVTRQGTDLQLVSRSSRDQMPDWSPDAQRIVFAREAALVHQGPGSNVLIAAVAPKSQRRPRYLTRTRYAHAYFPVWSPDGRYIAFSRSRGTTVVGALWIMRADGRRKRLIARRIAYSRISWQPRPRR